jgi:DHA1 family multidrug resistance protein-like MFS transporter
MADYIREAPIGQLLRWATKNRILKYPEELPDWQCPTPYVASEDEQETGDQQPTEKVDSTPASPPSEATEGLDKIATASPDEEDEEDDDEERRQRREPRLEGIRTRRTQISRVGTRTALQRSLTQKDLEAQFEQALAAETMPSRPIIPDKLDDGTILVDWYSTDDPANPQNWTMAKKMSTTLLIW